MNTLSVGSQIAGFLISALFSAYIGVVLIRLLLGFARADFHNPLSQFIVKITNPVLIPMRRFIPAVGKIDSAAVLLAFTLTVIKVALLTLVGYFAISNIPQLLLFSLGDFIKTIIYIYIVALVIQVVISWIGTAQGNPFLPVINSLTKPIIDPIRRIVPTVGMMDFSAFVAILLLNVLLIIVTNIFNQL